MVREGEKKLIAVIRRKLKQFGQAAAHAAIQSAHHALAVERHEHTHGITIHLLKDGSGEDNPPPDPATKAAAEAAAIAAIDAIDWELLIDPTEEELAAVAMDGARQALLRIGITDQGITDQVFKESRDWAEQRAAELVGMKRTAAGFIENPAAEFVISQDIRTAIQELVTTAIDEGKPALDLGDEIEALGGFSPDRAEMIARTEIIRANNQGHLVAFAASGVVDMKEWSTAEDGDVCEVCMANEEQGPIPLDDTFESGDDAAPAHPNCRCTIVAVIPDYAPEADSEDEQ
jgi:SPP1 gp7 family putative phage head morphogenesis protein